ncbi:MAG: hypothetical protein HC921_14610 [Synechococcaceae cyanobacterium SM2_3_1]|nr:hypothetical protein [Synechococcaceae cyanobacterium SM2_3_1]
MILDADYRGYRIAQMLSELLGGEALISYTLHWDEDGRPRKATCRVASNTSPTPCLETHVLTLPEVA